MTGDKIRAPKKGWSGTIPREQEVVSLLTAAASPKIVATGQGSSGGSAGTNISFAQTRTPNDETRNHVNMDDTVARSIGSSLRSTARLPSPRGGTGKIGGQEKEEEVRPARSTTAEVRDSLR